MISGLLHGLVVLMLGLTATVVEKTGAVAYLTVDPGPADGSEIANLSALISSPSMSGSGSQRGSASDASTPQGLLEIGSLASIEVNLATELGNQAAPGVMDELMELTGPNGVGLQDVGQQSGQAEFFGVQASGDEFVFVVDSSRSMKENRKWSRATRELLDSIGRLNENQRFCVFFFDLGTHLMFNSKPKELAMLPPTTENKTKLKRWITSISFGPATRPRESMGYALKMNPDAIFLLSDGEFRDGTVQFLREANFVPDEEGGFESKVTIHTICFRSESGRDNLELIANDHNGTFRFVR